MHPQDPQHQEAVEGPFWEGNLPRASIGQLGPNVQLPESFLHMLWLLGKALLFWKQLLPWQAAPTLPADRIAEAARVMSGQGKRKAKARSSPKFTSSGPSCKQVLVSFDKEHGVPSMNLAMVSATVSAALRNGGKRLRVQSTSPAYDGWSLSTSAIATTVEIDIICECIWEILPQDRRGNNVVKCW
ncbi:hypothetical protein L218DRAFT_996174 [Marasmius fiardii PR-910]|nr:hypothetical protein L218DRAFT_996174 [Marasmius fiardii PR-910]